jgi:hypothetical protein
MDTYKIRPGLLLRFNLSKEDLQYWNIPHDYLNTIVMVQSVAKYMIYVKALHPQTEDCEHYFQLIYFKKRELHPVNTLNPFKE